MKISRNINNLFMLTKRNIKLFTKNKTTVFFSLLAPVLILIIFITFMGDVQISLIEGMLPADVNVDPSLIAAIVSAWMIAGVLGIACLSVGLNSTLPLVQDKQNRATDDFTASPIKPVNLLFSYLFSAVFITFTLSLIILIISLTYLWIATGIAFSFIIVLELFLILFLSSLSSVTLMLCVMSFFKTTQSSTAFTGVYTALIGFVTGAYLPLDFLPDPVQNVAAFVPGTHSIGLFRSVFINNILNNLPADTDSESIYQLQNAFSLELNVFGAQLSTSAMYGILAGSTVLFFILYLIIDRIQRRHIF